MLDTFKSAKASEERFWSKVDKTEGCWNWKGGKFTEGYGRFGIGNKDRYAHRVAYEMLVGSVPKGLVIDHLCRNRICVNPAHMEVVTNEENLRRGLPSICEQMAAKVYCTRGHLLSRENCYPDRFALGWRDCKLCARIRANARYARIKKAHAR